MRGKSLVITLSLTLLLFISLSCVENQTDTKSSNTISWTPKQACYFLQNFEELKPSSASIRNNFNLDEETFCSSNLKEFRGSDSTLSNTVQFFAQGKKKEVNQLILELYINNIKSDVEARKLFASASLTLFTEAFKSEPGEDLKRNLQSGTPQVIEVNKTIVKIEREDFVGKITGKKGYKVRFVIGLYD